MWGMKVPDLQMFNAPSGKTSMTRFLNFMVTLIVMGVWAYISVAAGHMVMLDPGVLAAILILTGQKTAESFAETKRPTIYNNGADNNLLELADRRKQ